MSPFLLSESVVKLVIYHLMLGNYLCEEVDPRPSFLKLQHHSCHIQERDNLRDKYQTINLKISLHEGNVAKIINVTTKKYNVESIFT